MQEHVAPQFIPVKIYRSDERLTVAAPMPGLEPQDIAVEVTADGRLILDGALRATLKGVKDLLVDEWSVGGYHRELLLPTAVDATLATVTYGNGVVVIAFPLTELMKPGILTLTELSAVRGEHVGSAGHPVRPVSTEEHLRSLADEQRQHAGADDKPGPELSGTL